MKAEPESPPRRSTKAPFAKAPQRPARLAAEVARVLAGMTYEERVRAYRSGALSAHELAVVAGWSPEEMPILNGEYEWIAISLADLD